MTDEEAIKLVLKTFTESNIPVARCTVRRFPGELIVIVEVMEKYLSSAMAVASGLDGRIENGFVTIKKVAGKARLIASKKISSVLDPRVNDLIELLNARSRTSEQQPSLHYVKDAAQTLGVAVSRRHHLIFGRRGVGKTALMLEAKKQAENRGSATFWINIQTMRNLSAHDAFLTTAARLCDIPDVVHAGRTKKPLSVEKASELRSRISKLLGAGGSKEREIARLIPDAQQMFHLVGGETQQNFFVFLDDFHYLAVRQQPIFLDMIHALSRDNPFWIKAAGIKHQSRWFTYGPPTGLQTGHDAAIIDLDVTLEQPAKAKEFLISILRAYTDEARLGMDVISGAALDRTVLASGGVPRDFLILCATAIQVSRQRANARAAGVQDVNEAAGRIAKIKLQEVEDDAASSTGKAAVRTEALNRLRTFLINDHQITYFRIDFRDKELHVREYELLQSLMDLRLIHLISSSLSDERHAGHRSEVYMLDLSQFSGTRLRRNLKALDFIKNYLVLKDTGGKAPLREGDTPNRLLGILRRGPLFPLGQLTEYIQVGN